MLILYPTLYSYLAFVKDLVASVVQTAHGGVYIHVAADWVAPLTHPSNERKRTSKPVAHRFGNRVVQPGNRGKTVHIVLRLN